MLLEIVRLKESLWNTGSEEYRNQNLKRAQHEEDFRFLGLYPAPTFLLGFFFVVIDKIVET